MKCVICKTNTAKWLEEETGRVFCGDECYNLIEVKRSREQDDIEEEKTAELDFEEEEEEEEDIVQSFENLVFTKNNRQYVSRNVPILEIPEGAVLFRGVPATIKDTDNGFVGNIGWFSDLKIAGIYAFRQDKVAGQQIQQADGGKIISFKVKKPLRLFNLDNCDTLKHLKSIIKDKTILEQLSYIYSCDLDNKATRQSIYGIDIKVAQYICEKTRLDGWGYTTSTIGFHPEIMVCDPSSKIERIPLEYRYRMGTNDIAITSNGEVVKFESTDHVGGVKVSGQSYYKKDKNKQSDRFL